MKKTTLLFIINPKSGAGKFKLIKDLIEHHLDASKFKITIKFTEYASHAFELASENKSKYDIIAVVGGDGTINEVIRGVVNHDVILALLPAGSGNGLARTLGIPLKPEKALDIINNKKVLNIDTITINDKHFANVAGLGFDAHIGYLFDNANKRGFLSYIKIILREFKKYQPIDYKLVIDGKEVNKKAFLVSFANSTQFGNNAHIAPLAKLNDGIIDIPILKKFPLIASPFLAIKLFRKNIHKSKYYELLHAKKVEIITGGETLMHIDGEPCFYNGNIMMNINEGSLNVIVP